MYFEIDKFKPIAFHSYTSLVQDKIVSISFGKNDDIKRLRKDLISLFNEHEIMTIWGNKVQDDNKIVFEVEYNGVILFYGFYDWTFSIGFGCIVKNY